MATLKQTLNKKHGFESPEQEAMLNLWVTSDRLQNRFGRLFREYDVTASQYNVLRILRGHGGPLPCLEIAGQMIQAVPAITRVIEQLCRESLVKRRRSADDRRVVLVEITAKGQRLLKRLDGPLLKLHQLLLGHMSRTELNQLSELLTKAREHL